MADQVIVRNIPAPIQDWLAGGRIDGVSQNERILEALRKAYEDCSPKTSKQAFAETNLFGELERQAARLETPLFKFIDLFAGVGGMRLGLSAVGGQCVFTCERDAFCRKTYKAWYGDEEIAEDITDVPIASIPAHDVLAAGFPCQPFSLAGVSKKNSLGRQHGFLDETQGTLFFHLAHIIQKKKPPVILLENVKNLKSHDKGKTWATIARQLDELGYQVFNQVIDAARYVPQHRERIFIVGFLRSCFTSEVPFSFPEPPDEPKPTVSSILQSEVDPKYTLSDKLWKYLVDYAEKHRKKGNGFGYGIANPDGVSRTLSARYHKDGSEILIEQKGKNPRRLTPTECQALMGFPADLGIVVSDTQAYRQFGNAVVPTVVQDIARQIVKVMKWQLLRSNKHGCLLK